MSWKRTRPILDFSLSRSNIAASTGLLIFRKTTWAPIDWPSSKQKWASQSVWLRNISVKFISIVSSTSRLKSLNFNQNLHVNINGCTALVRQLEVWARMQLSLLTSISSVFQMLVLFLCDCFNVILSPQWVPRKTVIGLSCCRVQFFCNKKFLFCNSVVL